jgi:hypothetical protein
MSETYERPCRWCGVPILMKQNETGKWGALELEGGLPHWQTCTAWAAELEKREKKAKEDRRQAWLFDHPEVKKTAAARRTILREVAGYDAAVIRTVKADDGFEDDLPW